MPTDHLFLDRYGRVRALTRCADCGTLYELAADWPCPRCLHDDDLPETLDLELATA
jgi:rubrerythrin